MGGLKKIGRFIRNCVELYIPIIAFVALFLIFCFQVFMRYVALPTPKGRGPPHGQQPPPRV